MRHPIYPTIERRRIYLFRHGQAINAQASSMKYSSQQPLTDAGQTQATVMGEFLTDVPFDYAVASPYLRSLQTAEFILGERQSLLETSELFREVDIELGSLLEGANSADEAVQLIAGASWLMNEQFSDEMQECAQRAKKAIEFLLNKDWSVALVAAHAGFNRVFICELLGLPTSFGIRLEQDYVGMSILELNVDIETKQLLHATLRELNVTPYDHAKLRSRLTDIENLALETRPLIEKMFQDRAK